MLHRVIFCSDKGTIFKEGTIGKGMRSRSKRWNKLRFPFSPVPLIGSKFSKAPNILSVFMGRVLFVVGLHY